MKVSIITVCYNAAKTIEDTIRSVLSQTYDDIEYIIVDGASSDDTLGIIKRYKDRIATVISERDSGIYDAMNKGIEAATGDIVGILNSDDFYISNEVISKMVELFETKKVDSVFADLVYVRPDDLQKVVRYFDSSKFDIEKFAFGLMPAHPTFFVKKEIYERFGYFKTDYKISADLDIMMRFLYTNKISYFYLNEPIIKMRLGGVSTSGLRNMLLTNNLEALRACRENGIDTNLFKILSKYPKKLFELIKR